TPSEAFVETLATQGGSTDIDNVCSVTNSCRHFEQAPSFLAAISFGTCVHSYPAMIGAKVARPDRTATGGVGDGAWGMSLAMASCNSHELPVRLLPKYTGSTG